jgi:nitrogen fixation protein NifB
MKRTTTIGAHAPEDRSHNDNRALTAQTGLSVIPDGRPSALVPAGLERHPCFGGAPGRHARLHLPVAPACNILCRFCDRRFDRTSARPGVARRVVRPEEAPALVARALTLCPDLTVIGVAGPGDALATPHALDALTRVQEAFPELVGCLSTNGLRLPEHVARIVDAGVRAVTVTVNALDPRVLVRLVAGVVHDREVVRGLEGAAFLAAQQRAGIALAARAGIAVKVNAVLVPGVNEDELAAVARAVAALGARTMNVIPLIPQAELANLPAPSCEALEAARAGTERYLPVFRNCQRCRADACGVPGGRDLSAELYGDAAAALDTFSHG